MPAPIDLDQFEQAAQKSGKIHISSDNKVSSSSQSLLRRLRGANSKEKEENQAVRKALLESLEAKFGKGFAEIAAKTLDVDSPRSLDAKKVQELINRGKNYQELNQTANRIISGAYSPGSPSFDQGNFESMFASKAEEMGFKQPMSELNLQKLQDDIKTAIAREADGDRTMLTEGKVRQLVSQEIQKSIGQNMGLEVGKSVDQQQQQDVQAYAQSSPPLKTPPPSVLPPMPGEQPAALQRSHSVRDDLNKKGAVSNNPFKVQDDAMKAGKPTRNALPSSNKPGAPAKSSSIKRG
ncbi:MAG: hypothetical protein IPK22_19965 [Verrucomicrobiaceae bacterium]|nr:hypothetical protein [Verrucomicrobiaceae bacterium]